MSSEPTTPDPYDAVLADLRAQRDQIDSAIQAIERVRGLKTSAPVQGPVPQAETSNGTVPQGAFFSLTLPEAAIKLLGMKKRNLTNAEIVGGIEAGGIVMQSADKMNTINSVLTRRFQSHGDIVKVSRGLWGLKEWHPNLRFRAREIDPQDEAAAVASAEQDGDL